MCCQPLHTAVRGLASAKEWKAWSKDGLRPSYVPADPSQAYKDHGWQGWAHWLGTGNRPGCQRGGHRAALNRGANPGPCTITGTNAGASGKCSAGTLGAPPGKRSARQH